MSGQYDTEVQAAAELMPRMALRSDLTAEDAERIKVDHLSACCVEAGVELGAYDRRIIAWLGRWEPTTAQVIGALIGRAHVAGRTCGTAAGDVAP